VVPFALDAEDRERLMATLLSPADVGRFGVHLVEAGEDAALLSLQVAADVFLDTFGNTPELLRAEYADLLPSMTHLLVVDRTARAAVGTLILQRGPAERLKTLVDLAQPPWSVPVGRALGSLDLAAGDRSAADLLLLAVAPEHRNRGLAPLLMYAGWVASVHLGVERWTAILDDGLLAGLDQMTGGAIGRVGGSMPYLGSAASTPITVRMRPAEDTDLLRRMQAVGALAASRVAFDARLEPMRKAFQLLELEASPAATTSGRAAQRGPVPAPRVDAGTRTPVG
jgi:ribosomal protein S18 acetylase RimI-like enzyme